MVERIAFDRSPQVLSGEDLCVFFIGVLSFGVFRVASESLWRDASSSVVELICALRRSSFFELVPHPWV